MTPSARAALRRRALTAAGAALSLLALAGPASAATGPALYADGLHVATGGIVDPDGNVWVSDHNAGFCRVTGPTDRGPGTIDHPRQPGAADDVARTCLGGLLPDAAPGPDAAGAPAFHDPTPETVNGDEIVLIPDGAAPSNAVYRATWNPHEHIFETDPATDVIAMDADPAQPDRPRPTAVSIAPDGDAYVVFQRSGTIQKIDEPASATPVVQLVGSTSDARGAAAVAAGYGPLGPLGPPMVQVAETTGLRQISGVPGDATVATSPSPLSVPAPSAVSALAYEVTDPIEGRGAYYAGTADAVAPLVLPGPDRVLRLDADGPGQEIATGFSSVGGLVLRPVADGADALLVVDEPALSLDAEPMGMGRMFSIGAPITTLLTGPSAPASQPALDPRHTADSTPTFTFTGEGTARECSITPATAAANAWGPCRADAATPATSHTPAAALADGEYRFAVRTRDGAVAGPPETRYFTVDTTAPTATPVIQSPRHDGVYPKAPRYALDSSDPNEPEAGYQCKVDDLGITTDAPAYAPCAEGRPELADGTYGLQVRLVDAAGNVGAVESDSTPTVEDDPATAEVDERALSEGAQPTRFVVGRDTATDIAAPGAAAALSHPGSASLYATGLHIATGAVEDPAGRVWISDHNAGFCRVTDPTTDGSGAIEHPQTPGRPRTEPRTCLGGLLPEAGTGADAGGPPAFLDPTPLRPGNGDEVVLIADGFAHSNFLVRLGWDPETERFEYRDQITVPSVERPVQERPRPVATAVGPDPDGPTGPKQADVFFVNTRDGYVGRVSDAAGDPQVSIAGFVSGGADRAEAVAVGQRTVEIGPAPEGGTAPTEQRPVVYISDPNGFAVLDPAPAGSANVAARTPAAQTRAIPGVTAPSALTYDLARDLLYVGTADALTPPTAASPAVDRLVTYDPATDAVVREVGGFTMVGGIGLRRDGRVLVTDDSALVMEAEPMGRGRLIQVGAPAAQITSGPSNLPGLVAADPASTGDSTPDFTIAGDGPLQCALRPAGATSALRWTGCQPGRITADADPEAAGTQPLADGEWKLTVRSQAGAPPADGEDTTRFVPQTSRFTVDTLRPAQPAVSDVRPNLATAPGARPITNAAPFFTFSGEPGVTYSCTLNGTVKNPCRPGRTFPLGGVLTVLTGANSLRITATDRAGNVSVPSPAFPFTADADVPTVAISAPVEGQVTGTEARFVFKASKTANTTYGCRLDGATFKRCDGPADAGGRGEPYAIEMLSDGSVQVTYRDLAPGAHRFQVHASDDHGNVSANATRRIRVDVNAPTVLVDEPAPNATTGTATTIVSHIDPATIGENETNTVQCTLTRGTTAVALGECDERIPVSGLQDGLHTFTIRATDSAGNVGQTASRTWRVDGAGPAISIAQLGTGFLAAPTFTITTNEPATLQCRYDARPMEDCATVNGRNLGRGQHTLHVVGTDAFGNVSQASRQFTLVLAQSANTVVPTQVTRAAVQATGLPVTFEADQGTALVRFRIFRQVTAPTAARAARKAARTSAFKRVATVNRRTAKAGVYRRRLNERAVRDALTPGLYRVETRLKSTAGVYGERAHQWVRVKRSKR